MHALKEHCTHRFAKRGGSSLTRPLNLASDRTDFVERGSVCDCDVKPHVSYKCVLVRVRIAFSENLDADVVTHADHEI